MHLAQDDMHKAAPLFKDGAPSRPPHLRATDHSSKSISVCPAEPVRWGGNSRIFPAGLFLLQRPASSSPASSSVHRLQHQVMLHVLHISVMHQLLMSSEPSDLGPGMSLSSHPFSHSPSSSSSLYIFSLLRENNTRYRKHQCAL